MYNQTVLAPLPLSQNLLHLYLPNHSHLYHLQLLIVLAHPIQFNYLNSITSSGFSWIISDPAHILQNSSSSIDLISTNQLNLVITSGVNPPLHPNCHHQIVFVKLNLKIGYPVLYEHLT